MLRLADVVSRHGPAYLALHRDAILPSHVRALTAITYCRTPALGAHLGVCARCDHRHLLFHSCRHRACPRCGHDSTERWLAHQVDLLLPVPYFHVVFTLPRQLHRLVRSHQRELYAVLFKAAFAALKALCADERHLDGEVGALAVLHTWTRALVYHPHVHMLVPGGALASDGTWRPVRHANGRYLVPVKPLAKLFAGKFLAMTRRALPGVRIPSLPMGTRWVVYAKPTVQGADEVLRYLGRYVHRTAIADGALVACKDDAVTFRYRDSQRGERRTMTLPPHEFLRRFLQHVLPRGLHRVRAYGLLHPSRRDVLRRLQLVLHDSRSPAAAAPSSLSAHQRRTCPRCREGSIILIRRLDAEQCLQWLAGAEHLAQAAARAPPLPPGVHIS